MQILEIPVQRNLFQSAKPTNRQNCDCKVLVLEYIF